MKNLVCAFILSLALGCTTAVVRPYVGEQQAWPTANGSIVNVRYDLPVFTSLPPNPYDVIAELRIDSPLYAQPEEHHLALLVKRGIQLGADALVFVDGQSYFGTSYGGRSGDAGAIAKQSALTQVNKFNPLSFGSGVNIIAIRWVGDPPPGLPARYARYSEKMFRVNPSGAPTNGAEPAAESPKAEAPAAAAPVAPAASATPAAPSAPTTNIMPAHPATPAPATPAN